MTKTNKPFTLEEFNELYSRVPRLCVDLVIKSVKGTLLTRRAIPPHKGQWHLPGGTVFLKEPLTETASRVARDELGVSISVEKLLGYMEFPDQDKPGGLGYPISLAFLCSANTDNFKLNDEASEAKYFASLPDDMVPEQKDFLETLPS